MARKKKGALAGLVRNAREISSFKGNKILAPLWNMTTTYVAPAVVGYATTRVVGRLVRNLVAPRFPKLAGASNIAASVGTLFGLWYLTSKVKSLSNYQAGVLAGSGIAAVQSLISALMPKLGAAVFDAPVSTGAAYVDSDEEGGGDDMEEPMSDEAPSEEEAEIAAIEGEDEDYDEFREGIFN